MTWAGAALAQLDRIPARDAAAGLKAALEKGSRAAVAQLGRTDGFFADARVRIPLPQSLARAEQVLRRFGTGRQADELVLAMNRAAEAAVPQARELFVDAVKRMTVEDAKAILREGDTAATAYFRRTTQEALHARFLPVVQRETARVGVARYYKSFAGHGAAFGLIDEEHADLDRYVTGKALDGLFLVLAEKEKEIRRDPAGAGSALLRRVFGALQR